MSGSNLTLPTRTEAEARQEREMRAAQKARPLLDDHCDHANINAHGTRCLSCGHWLRPEVWP